MNITSYFANKCLEFLLSVSEERDKKQNGESPASQEIQSIFSPPWIKDTQYFKQNCDSCGKCIVSCENNVLFLDKENYPRIDFLKGECSFCGNCAQSCPQDIFDYDLVNLPWELKAFVTLDCLSHNNVLCRTCAEHCEAEAIIISKTNGTISAPSVHANKCNGCGACFSPCPVRAIKITSITHRISEMIIQEEGI